MEVKIFGEKYLIMGNYDKIMIKDGPVDGIDIIVECTKQEDTLSILDNNENKDLVSNWTFLSNLSEFDRLKEVVDYFLKDNVITSIRSIYPSNYYYDLTVETSNNKSLVLEFNFDKSFRKYIDKYIIENIYLKYKNDCLHFLDNLGNKKYYHYITHLPFLLMSYGVEPLSSNNLSYYLRVEDACNAQEKAEAVVIIGKITDNFALFEERLNQEQEEATLEIINKEKTIFRVICNDCIFVFSSIDVNLLKIIELENMIEKHNQSIKKGKKLLMDLEEGNRELWLKWE